MVYAIPEHLLMMMMMTFVTMKVLLGSSRLRGLFPVGHVYRTVPGCWTAGLGLPVLPCKVLPCYSCAGELALVWASPFHSVSIPHPM